MTEHSATTHRVGLLEGCDGLSCGDTYPGRDRSLPVWLEISPMAA